MGGSASVPVDRRVKPKVFCVGLQRTGTLSTALAFDILGYSPTSHGGTQLIRREDGYNRDWYELYTLAEKGGSRAEILKKLQGLTEGFGAVADAPYNQWVEELAELYPDAKFVDLTRDRAAWWKSIQPVNANADTKGLGTFLLPAPGWRWLWYVGQGLFKRAHVTGVVTLKDHDALERHNDYVRRSVPSDRLLVMSVKDGWKPLCDFLGKPIPDEPFPHANEAAAIATIMPKVLMKTSLIWLGLIAVTGGTAWAGWTTWKGL